MSLDQTPTDFSGEISGPIPISNEEPLSPIQNEPQPLVQSKPRIWVHLVLFGTTIFTTLIAGAILEGVNPFASPGELFRGIPFSFTLIAILFTHEMGHYLTSRYHGVEATLPYFIPAPPFPPLPIGTFGAVIRMRSPIMSKKALIDIGASGPIAGYIVSILAVAFGLHGSQVVESQHFSGIGLGSSLGFQFLSFLIIGPIQDGYDVMLGPMAFAGWIGFFITALNLIPAGQLDGGHVVYAILGKRHRIISIAMVPILIMMGFLGWPGWFLWAVLVTLIGVGHPPTMIPNERLDGTRKAIGWITLLIFILCFTPVPFFIV